jgi:hypothetical protein
VLDGEQDASIRLVGEQSQQPGVLNVRLGEGQSTISDGARAAHGLRQPQRELPIGTGVAINEIPKRFRNVVTVDIAATLDFEGDIF